MKMLNFNAPQEALAPQFYRREVDLSKVIAGGFVRNSVLSAMTYGGNMLVPSFLKTCDAIHPMVGSEDFDGLTQSCYGALLDSANTDATRAAIKSVVQPWNTAIVWSPGGRGLDSWLAVKLPEATLVERYIVASTNTTCPLSWKLQGSNDGENWIDVDTITNTEMWSLSTTREEKEFTIPAETRGTYLWYRIYITASNSDTMSISTFRLLRPASVCAKGQLRLDASAGNPLVLSFMDGFAADGVTPVDYTETLSSAIVQAPGYFDSYGTPITGITTPTPVDVYAKRTANGSVSLELVVAGQEDVPYFPGRMTNYAQNGMVCTFTIGSDDSYFPAYSSWGDGAVYYTKSKKLGDSILKRIDGEPFFITKAKGSNCTDRYDVSLSCYIEENDGSLIQLENKADDYSKNCLNVINRYVRSIRYPYSRTNNLQWARGTKIYGRKSPLRYRYTGGKMYQRDTAEGAVWETVQKIKLGTFVINGDNFYQPRPVRPLSVWGMTQGDAMTYLDA